MMNINKKLKKIKILFLILLMLIFNLFPIIFIDQPVKPFEQNFDEAITPSKTRFDNKNEQSPALDNNDAIMHTKIKISESKTTPMGETRNHVRSNNTAPYFIKELEDLILDEDFGIFDLNLTDVAYDNEDPPEMLKWYITGENVSLINITNENNLGQIIRIRSVPNAYGVNIFKLWVEDSTGRNNFIELKLTVNPINDQPYLDSTKIPNINLNRNATYSINLKPYIIDYDTSIDRIKASVLVEDQVIASINEFILKLNFSKNNNFNKGFITLFITDGQNNSMPTSNKVFINITDNFPPKTIQKIPDIVLHQDETLTKIIDLDYYFIDPDHGRSQLVYEYYLGDHLKIKINKDNSVDIKSENSWMGTEYLIFRCLDPLGGFNEQVINVTISKRSLTLNFFPIPNLMVHFGYKYEFNLRPYIKSNKNLELLNYEIFEFINDKWIVYTENENINITNRKTPVLIINYSVEYLNKKVPIFLSVSDDKLSKFQEFIITITDNFPPAIIKPIQNQQLEEDQVKNSIFDLYEYFTDFEDTVLDFINISENIKINIQDNGLVDVTLNPDWFGTELVIIRALDSSHAISETSFWITVESINDAPVIMKIPTINITKGIINSFEYSKYLGDVDDNLTDLEVTIDGQYVTVAGNFLILDYPNSAKNKQSFTIFVSDGELTSNQVINVTLLASAEPKVGENISMAPWMFWIVILILGLMLIFLIITFVVYIKRLRQFRFNDIYCIYKDGLLIAHATRRKKAGYDSDIIGSMFTAIQDFIQESFSTPTPKVSKSTLKKLDFGDFQIVIDRGEYIYIAAIFTGFALHKMLVKIGNLRREIEEKYKDILPKWNGNMSQMKGTQKMLEELLFSTGAINEHSPKSKSEKEPTKDYEDLNFDKNEGIISEGSEGKLIDE